MSEQELLLRSTVVTAIASLQAYINDVVDEKCDNLPNDWAQLTLVQQRYIGVHAHRLAVELTGQYQEADLSNTANIQAFMDRLGECAQWKINPNDFTRLASKKDVQGFLNNNGTRALERAISLHQPAQRFIDWLGPQVPYRNLLDRVDPIIQLRNDAAHGTFTRRVTEREGREYVVVVNQLVDKIDEYLGLP